jgi:DHHA1 domain
MIDPAKLTAVKTIIVHGGGCPDGIASAMLLHDALPHAEVRFVQYQTPEQFNLEPAPGMLFCDITPHVPYVDVDGKKALDPDRLKVWVDSGAIVLDHHKSAKGVAKAFGDMGAFGDEVDDPGVCGAVLAYRHVWLPLYEARHASYPTQARIIDVEAAEEMTAENFATLAGIRDTWLNKHPRWREAVIQAEMLRFYPIEHWMGIVHPFILTHTETWAERRKIGEVLVERHEKSVTRTLEKVWKFTTTKGTRVLMFEGTGQSSDAAEVVDKEADIVIGFGFVVENGEQKMILSMRSHTGYDVSAIAKSFGGGGHSAAAGFNAVIPATINPYSFTELLVNSFEQKA